MSSSALRLALLSFVILLSTPLAGYGQTLTVTATAGATTPQSVLIGVPTVTPVTATLSNPPPLASTPQFGWSIGAVSGPDGTTPATMEGYYAYVEDANVAFDNPMVAATNFRATLYKAGSWQFDLRVTVAGSVTQIYAPEPVGGTTDCTVSIAASDTSGTSGTPTESMFPNASPTAGSSNGQPLPQSSQPTAGPAMPAPGNAGLLAASTSSSPIITPTQAPSLLPAQEPQPDGLPKPEGLKIGDAAWNAYRPDDQAAIRKWWDKLPAARQEEINGRLDKPAAAQSSATQGAILDHEYSRKLDYPKKRAEWLARARKAQETRAKQAAELAKAWKDDQDLRRKAAETLSNEGQTMRQVRKKKSLFRPRDYTAEELEKLDKSRQALNPHFKVTKEGDSYKVDYIDKEGKELAARMKDSLKVAEMTLGQRLLGAVESALRNDKLSEEGRRQLTVLRDTLSDPTNQAIIGGLAVVSVGAQFTPAGPALDGLIGAVGFVMMGKTVVEVTEDLFEFVTTALGAVRQEDLDAAGQALARGFVKGGLEGVQIGVAAGAPKLAVAAFRRFKRLRGAKIKPTEEGSVIVEPGPASAGNPGGPGGGRLGRNGAGATRNPRNPEGPGDGQMGRNVPGAPRGGGPEGTAPSGGTSGPNPTSSRKPGKHLAEGTKPSAPKSLREKTPEELADLRRNGQISDKDLKKGGFSSDEIREINENAKNAGRKAAGGHDRNKIIDSTEGSKKALDDALENLRKNPADPAAQQAAQDAQRQVDEIQRAKAKIDKLRKQREKKNE